MNGASVSTKYIYIICITICLLGGMRAFSTFDALHNHLTIYPHHTIHVIKHVENYKKRAKTIPLIHKQKILHINQLLDDIKPHTPQDSHLTKFVGPGNSYTNPLYVPFDLEPINQDIHIHFNAPPIQDFKIRKAVQIPLQNLATAYTKKFGQLLSINSAWRSYHTQQNKFSASCMTNSLCAYPGTSEHQNGYTIDIQHLHGERYQWMKKMLINFDFINRIKKVKKLMDSKKNIDIEDESESH